MRSHEYKTTALGDPLNAMWKFFEIFFQDRTSGCGMPVQTPAGRLRYHDGP